MSEEKANPVEAVVALYERFQGFDELTATGRERRTYLAAQIIHRLKEIDPTSVNIDTAYPFLLAEAAGAAVTTFEGNGQERLARWGQTQLTRFSAVLSPTDRVSGAAVVALVARGASPQA